MLALTRRLLQLRRTHSELALGAYRAIENTPEDCLAYIRDLGPSRSLVILNFSDQPAIVELDQHRNPGAELIATTHTPHHNVDLRNLSLDGNEGVVISLKRPATMPTGHPQ
jgi:hypothetical protein